MENILERKKIITNLLFSSHLQESNHRGYLSLDEKTYGQILQVIIELIKNDDTEFTFDLKNKFPSINFKNFVRDEIIEENRFLIQSGNDIYSYIKLRVESINEPSLIIREELPDFLGELIKGNKTKRECIEWIEVYPFILKALQDHCIKNRIIGIKFTLMDVRFHPIDFKAYAYYVCAKRLLEKIKSIN